MATGEIHQIRQYAQIIKRFLVRQSIPAGYIVQMQSQIVGFLQTLALPIRS